MENVNLGFRKRRSKTIIAPRCTCSDFLFVLFWGATAEKIIPMARWYDWTFSNFPVCRFSRKVHQTRKLNKNWKLTKNTFLLCSKIWKLLQYTNEFSCKNCKLSTPCTLFASLFWILGIRNRILGIRNMTKYTMCGTLGGGWLWSLLGRCSRGWHVCGGTKVCIWAAWPVPVLCKHGFVSLRSFYADIQNKFVITTRKHCLLCSRDKRRGNVWTSTHDKHSGQLAVIRQFLRNWRDAILRFRSFLIFVTSDMQFL